MGSVIDENTGEEPNCTICDSVWGEGCGHLVAWIDYTFGEVASGELYNRDHEFRLQLQAVFLELLGSDAAVIWQDADLAELWTDAQLEYNDEAVDLNFDRNKLLRLVEKILVNAGSNKHPGNIAEYGPPGMSSSISLLFGEAPAMVVDAALKRLEAMLVEDRISR